MFRFEDNLPEYWLNESRDFQLLARLDDVLYMGQRADIFTISNLNSSKKCKNTFLNLLAKKVGFFTDKYIEDKVLRNIIGAFRLAVKHKGTKEGIIYAVTAILKAENSTGVPRVDIITENEQYVINIFTPINLINEVALKEFLKYIIPAGFIYNIYSYVHDVPEQLTKLNISSQVKHVAYFNNPVVENGEETWSGNVQSGDLSKITDKITDENYLRLNYGSASNQGQVIGGDVAIYANEQIADDGSVIIPNTEEEILVSNDDIDIVEQT